MERNQKHRRLRAVVAACSALVLLSATRSSSFGGEVWKLSGRVLNDDLKPVVGMPNVEITVYPDENPTSKPVLPPALSGGDGSFELDCPLTGSLLVIRYKKTGHQIMLPATVVRSAQAASKLPEARCRQARTSTGLTAFKPEEILSTLAARQKDLSSGDSISRTFDDIEILRAEKVNTKVIEAAELDPKFKEFKKQRGLPGGDERRSTS